MSKPLKVVRLVTRFIGRGVVLGIAMVCLLGGGLSGGVAGAAGSPGVGAGTTRAGTPGSSTTTTASDLGLPSSYTLVSLGTLYQEVKAHQVPRAIVDPVEDVVAYRTVSGHNQAALFVDGSAGTITQYLLANGVDASVGPAPSAPPSVTSGLGAFVPFLLVGSAAVVVILLRRRKKQIDPASGTLFGRKSKGGPPAKVEDSNIPTTTFADVGGVDEASADLAEIVEFLRDPERFAKVGAVIPKGALLTGPPGTGKTLLARAVAGEAKVAFFAVSGSDFAEVYVGVGAKRVRDLFAKARAAGQAIVFIDEIDAIAKKRAAAGSAADSERESTLIALLNEMDGFRDSGVIVVAATNRPDALDPAIVRPGRLDRRVEVPLPDRRGREKILAIHAASRPLANDVDLAALAGRTAGMSGADLAQVVNEAAIGAARDHGDIVDAACFEEAIATVAMGRARHSAVVTEADRLVTAWHEAGHTVCAYVQDAADRPVSVSIIPRGGAGGVTWMATGDEQFLQRSKASARLVTALGGRAAEELLLGADITQGAYGDLQTATNLASTMATQFGMTGLGLMVRDPQSMGQSATEGVTDVVEELLAHALDEAQRLLAEHREFFDALVVALLANDTLNAAEIDALYDGIELPGKVAPKAVLAPMHASRPRTPPRPTPVPERAAPQPSGSAAPRRRRRTVRERVGVAISAFWSDDREASASS